jgi:hypothetical protein
VTGLADVARKRVELPGIIMEINDLREFDRSSLRRAYSAASPPVPRLALSLKPLDWPSDGRFAAFTVFR